MLAPDYLDHAPDRLVLLWQQVEDDILRTWPGASPKWTP